MAPRRDVSTLYNAHSQKAHNKRLKQELIIMPKPLRSKNPNPRLEVVKERWFPRSLVGSSTSRGHNFDIQTLFLVLFGLLERFFQALQV
jgi:hypothetical protein